MQLIDKDAVVAEIKRRIQESLDAGGATRGVYLSERMKEDSYILSFINTLEVKEVDLEKVFLDEYSKFSNDVDAMDYAFPIDLADYKDFAKHFFELGINAKKGE